MNNIRGKNFLGKRIKFFNVPKFSRAKVNLFDKKNHPGILLIKKLRDKGIVNRQFKNFMSLKLLLKTINNLYEEKLILSKDNIVIREQEMHVFAFNILLNRYFFFFNK